MTMLLQASHVDNATWNARIDNVGQSPPRLVSPSAPCPSPDLRREGNSPLWPLVLCVANSSLFAVLRDLLFHQRKKRITAADSTRGVIKTETKTETKTKTNT